MTELRYSGEPKSPVVSAVSFVIKVILVAWMLAYGTGALALLINGWLHDYNWLRFILQTDETIPKALANLFHVVIGGIIGAAVGGMVNFHKYESMEGDFQLRHVWGYIIAPWVSAFVAIAIYALIRAGLFVFGAEFDADKTTDLSILSFFAIGFISGFAWFEAVNRIQDIARKIFGGEAAQPEEDQESEATEQNPPAGTS